MTFENDTDRNEYIDIVFTGPPGPNPSDCGFVEVEDSKGISISIGTWIKREDGFTVLRIKK